MKALKRIGAGGLIAYLLLCTAAFFMQRQLLYFPPNIYVTPEAVNLPHMQEVQFTIDGTATTSWWAPPQDNTKAVIMFFHGNGSAVFSNYDIFADLTAQGYGLISVGYPGYPQKDSHVSESTGKPTQTALINAALRNYDYVTAQGIEPSRIVFFGTSLGSGVASQLAAIHNPRLLILDAPFNSTLDMAKKRMPFLPVNLLMKDKFESDKALKDLDVPLIWIHGTADRIVPITQGQKLYDGYMGPKSAHIIKGGRHVNLWTSGGDKIVLSRLGALLP